MNLSDGVRIQVPQEHGPLFVEPHSSSTYRSPKTVSRASSIPQSCSAVTCPTRSPSRVASTAPTCSTKTRVASPSTSTSGRKEAGRALREVGATRTTDLGNSSFAWTTTPKRRPCCSWPRRCGGLRTCTSPRSTQTLHEGRDFSHLAAIIFIGLERSHFLGKHLSFAQPGGGVHKCLPDGL